MRVIILIACFLVAPISGIAAFPGNLVLTDVIASMQATNSNWTSIDRAMQAVVKHGDSAVPFLAIYTRTDELMEYDAPWGFRKARALHLLALIGSPEAEMELLRVVGNVDKPDDVVVTSLAILNKQDVAESLLIDRAWYQHHYVKGEKASLVWWKKVGRRKYEAAYAKLSAE